MSEEYIHIAIIGKNEFPENWYEVFTKKYKLDFFENGFAFINDVPDKERFRAIISTGGYETVSGLPLAKTVKNLNIPFILISDQFPNKELIKLFIQSGITEVLHPFLSVADVESKLQFLLQLTAEDKKADQKEAEYKVPLGKRLFDIFFSSLLLLMLLPLFVIVAIIVKLESPGPVFYISKRVGTGYKIFSFYKFRTMYSDADKRLGQLAALNQYGAKKGDPLPPVLKRCGVCENSNKSCDQILFLDGSVVCEKLLIESQGNTEESAFVKFKNDPRVTRFGAFLRNTSVDELPQIINVLKGDMSVVGNRPLPLYEAERLTTDNFTTRFMAPAGITGLWQVTKRGGKGPMSQEERIGLDNEYAKNFSLQGDLRIILKTIPAMFQRENV